MSEYLALGTPILNIIALVCIIMLMSLWLIFNKAQRPGWAVLIPFYNAYILQSLSGKKWWWFLVLLTAFIPIIGLVTFAIWYVVVCMALAKCFNKGVGFTIGLVLLFFVFFPILAFDSSKYLSQRS